MRLYTGTGGMEMFTEIVERGLGYKRVYIGKKPMRILSRLGTMHKSPYTQKYYWRIKQTT
jgi:hypothetical protein